MPAPEQDWLIFVKTEILQIFSSNQRITFFSYGRIGGKRSVGVEKTSGQRICNAAPATRPPVPVLIGPEHKTDTATSLPILNSGVGTARPTWHAFRAAPSRLPRAPFDPERFPSPVPVRGPRCGPTCHPNPGTTPICPVRSPSTPFHRVLGPNPDPHVRWLKIV